MAAINCQNCLTIDFITKAVYSQLEYDKKINMLKYLLKCTKEIVGCESTITDYSKSKNKMAATNCQKCLTIDFITRAVYSKLENDEKINMVKKLLKLSTAECESIFTEKEAKDSEIENDSQIFLSQSNPNNSISTQTCQIIEMKKSNESFEKFSEEESGLLNYFFILFDIMFG
ncbi:hypothetical protein BpHYR1_049361 [Brachionus plicatilis]|uniref:Uncharacterized protein n=1 Tax=Brachionus plicatilis TaxID=10195 RepID=A0A3M7SRS3_BRAPC|nr:hypothetical protein BpHYR1_049361 [Brachionus plicatilis]